VIYIGDDTTDEDVFGMLRSNEIGLRVGSAFAASRADYRLQSTTAVRTLLEWVAAKGRQTQ
jgi:trehalose-6-phosphatase